MEKRIKKNINCYKQFLNIFFFIEEENKLIKIVRGRVAEPNGTLYGKLIGYYQMQMSMSDAIV